MKLILSSTTILLFIAVVIAVAAAAPARAKAYHGPMIRAMKQHHRRPKMYNHDSVRLEW